MTIQIETIVLPDLIIAEAFEPPVTARVEQSVINTPIVFETEKPSGQAITLTGGEDTGWITRSTMLSLVALASVPGATYTLNYEGVTYTVRFRHEDPPVIAAEAIVPRPNAAGTDYYRNVSIRLVEV